MNIYDVLHQLVDRAGLHSEQLVKDLHDTLSGHEQGFSNLEEYRKASAPVPTAAEEEQAVARLEEIRKRRQAQQALAEEQAQAIPTPAVRRSAPIGISGNPTATSAAPAAVAGSASSPTAEPDAAPTS